MINKIKGNILFKRLLKRPDINKAYAMVDKTDSWYNTISTVHNSLKEILMLPHEKLEIVSRDNLKLKGIYYHNNSDITVICAHGYTSHAEREWAFPGLFYISLGYNVLIPYQRAHGLSEGKFISFSALESLDMVTWANKINQLNKNGKIIFHGLSMGGQVVINASIYHIENLKCIICDAPSESITRLFYNVSKDMFKKNSDKIALYAIKRFRKEFKVDAKDYNITDTIKKCQYPIILSAGSNENKESLFNILKENNPNKTKIIILPGCDHGNGMYKQTNMYQSAIKEFINENI